MNERIKSVLSLLYENKGFVGGFNAAEEIAQHFYNLALEDVRKEIKRAEERNFKYFQEGLLMPETLSARDAQLLAFRDFINELTK